MNAFQHAARGHVVASACLLAALPALPACKGSPGIDVQPAGVTLHTSERGAAAQVRVSLTVAPSSDVTVGASSSDPAAGTAAPTSLKFTPENWETPQTITVTGMDDDHASGDTEYALVFAPAASADPGYSGLQAARVPLRNLDDDAAAVLVMPTVLATEEGGNAWFAVSLASEPLAEVTIGVASGDPSAGTASPSVLVFQPATWRTPRTVQVAGTDDHRVRGPRTYTVALAPAASADPAYAGLDPDDVTVTALEDDEAGVVVQARDPLLTDESGATDTFQVRLATQPAADVVIALSSSAPAEVSVAPSSLVFTSATWAAPQTVVVAGVADHLLDGDKAASVLVAAAVSGDTDYEGLDAADVSVVNRDVSEIAATSAGFELVPSGATDRVFLHPRLGPFVALPESDPAHLHPEQARCTPDVFNLQWALDHAAPGRTVTLRAGTYHLGDGGSYSAALGGFLGEGDFLAIEKDVRLVGELDPEGRQLAILNGGFAPLRFYEEVDAVVAGLRLEGYVMSGVLLGAAGDVSIERNVFRGGKKASQLPYGPWHKPVSVSEWHWMMSPAYVRPVNEAIDGWLVKLAQAGDADPRRTLLQTKGLYPGPVRAFYPAMRGTQVPAPANMTTIVNNIMAGTGKTIDDLAGTTGATYNSLLPAANVRRIRRVRVAGNEIDMSADGPAAAGYVAADSATYGSYLYGSGGISVWCVASPADIELAGNVVRNPTETGIGLNGAYASTSSLHDNVVEYTDFVPAPGASPTALKGNFHGLGYAGPGAMRIENNRVTHAPGDGINVTTASDTLVAGNRIDKTGTAGTGILLTKATRAAVSGNRVTGSGAAGIALVGASPDGIVAYNDLSAYTAAVRQIQVDRGGSGTSMPANAIIEGNKLGAYTGAGAALVAEGDGHALLRNDYAATGVPGFATGATAIQLEATCTGALVNEPGPFPASTSCATQLRDLGTGTTLLACP